MSAPTVVSTVTDGISSLGANLLLVAAAGIGVGGTVLALKRGWGLVKDFTH
jgi:hypothetical protein